MTTKNLKVLFIDDEENILNSLKRVFRRESVDAVFTNDPDEAFELAAKENFAVVVSDQRMPKLEGVEVLKRIQQISPDSVRMMLTGYADMKSAMRAVNEGKVFRFMAKPWAEDELRAAIVAGKVQYELVQENRRLSLLTQKQNQELSELNGGLERKVLERTEEVRKLNSELSTAFFSAIKLMGSLSGMLLPELEGHSLRVAKAAGFIAKELGLNERETFEVQVAAFVHNIGVLSPPSANLTPEQRAVEEVEVSARLVGLIPNIGLAPMSVKHQAERYDGTGFPQKLMGTAIPMGARIIAAAAAYEKALHHSGNAKATPLTALQDVKKDVDTRFDPVIVQGLERFVRVSMQEAGEVFEVALKVPEIRAGMIVSRPVRTRRGEVLVSQGHKFSEHEVEGLWLRQQNETEAVEIYVYEASLPPAKKAA